MSAAREIRRTRSELAHTAAAGSLLILALFRLSPRLDGLAPVCPVHRYLGVLCPGCGATRAVLALLHGHVAQAWHLNALFVCLLPPAVWFAGECYRRAVSAEVFEWPRLPAVVTHGLLAAGVIFGILRNLS